MARVPDIDAPTILRFLDRGIMGITGPHIVNGDRARQLADACRYVPRGNRSYGSGRGAYFSDFPPGVTGADYMAHANDNILVIAQLEDIEVLDNLDDILSVEGIDLFASGAQDIAQSLGLPGQPAHPRVREFERQVRGRRPRRRPPHGGRRNGVHARRPRLPGRGAGVHGGARWIASNGGDAGGAGRNAAQSRSQWDALANSRRLSALPSRSLRLRAS